MAARSTCTMNFPLFAIVPFFVDVFLSVESRDFWSAAAQFYVLFFFSLASSDSSPANGNLLFELRYVRAVSSVRVQCRTQLYCVECCKFIRSVVGVEYSVFSFVCRRISCSTQHTLTPYSRIFYNRKNTHTQHQC